MPRMQRTASARNMLVTVSAVCCAVVLPAGCSDDDTPSSVSSAASKAASAAESLGREATGAASSLASEASSAFASATAEAGRRLDDIQNGTDVKSDARLGTPGKDSDGRTSVEVTVTNTAGSQKSFAVQVDFLDASGDRVDTTVVTITDVPADGTGKGTARSNRDLSGEVKTQVARAVRY